MRHGCIDPVAQEWTELPQAARLQRMSSERAYRRGYKRGIYHLLRCIGLSRPEINEVSYYKQIEKWYLDCKANGSITHTDPTMDEMQYKNLMRIIAPSFSMSNEALQTLLETFKDE